MSTPNLKEPYSTEVSDDRRTNITTTYDQKDTQYQTDHSTKTVGNPYYAKAMKYKQRGTPRKSQYSKYRSKRKLSQENKHLNKFETTFGCRSSQPSLLHP